MKNRSRTRKTANATPKRQTCKLADVYKQFFVPLPSRLWKNDDDHYTLEQPSPFKWVESETTYGIGHIQENVCNA